jgi:rhamnose utilization protein RhaD (predicted bifunctional aldolase and dehydrogenase)
MDMMDRTEELIWLAREVGREDRRLVLGKEGTVSARLDDQTLRMKADGCRLAGCREEDTVVLNLEETSSLVDLQFLRPMELVEELSKRAVVRGASDTPGKPGIDACMHAWLLKQEGVHFVAQAHPVACLQLLCSPAADKTADNRMFPEEIIRCGQKSAYVPFADPGVSLAREVRSKVTLFSRQNYGRMPRVILIQNFGVITVGGTAEETLEALLMAERSAEILAGTARLGGVVFIPQQMVRRFASDMKLEEDGPRIR